MLDHNGGTEQDCLATPSLFLSNVCHLLSNIQDKILQEQWGWSVIVFISFRAFPKMNESTVLKNSPVNYVAGKWFPLWYEMMSHFLIYSVKHDQTLRAGWGLQKVRQGLDWSNEVIYCTNQLSFESQKLNCSFVIAQQEGSVV